MKKKVAPVLLFAALFGARISCAQVRIAPALRGRPEYIEVEDSPQLDLTSVAEARPIALIQECPMV